MAATDARPLPKKNTAFRLYFALRDNTGALVTSWAGQDSQRSLDGASFSDCTNEATEIGSSGIGYIDLTAAEMNTDATVLKVTVTSTDALPFVITLFPQDDGDIEANLDGAAVSELGSVPAANASLKDKVSWLFALARNKVTQTATTKTVRNDADDGNIATCTVGDDGTTFTRGEYS